MSKVDEPGFITIDELRSVLASLGQKQGGTLEDCKQMISKVGTPVSQFFSIF